MLNPVEQSLGGERRSLGVWIQALNLTRATRSSRYGSEHAPVHVQA
jgi:hypothetical protein